MDKKLRIAIVGIGDVFTRFYFKDKVLKKIHLEHPEYEIYCADKTEHWITGDKKINVRDDLKDAGFFFVDVSNTDLKRDNKKESFEAWLQEKAFDLIVIATPDFAHITAALEWLPSDFRIMIVEKPFSDDPERVNELLNDSRYKNEAGNPKVWAFSHFNAKIHEQFKNYSQLAAFLKENIGNLTKFRFFCLEDYSSADVDFIEKFVADESEKGNEIDPEINGPIEIPNRQIALNKGILFDVGSHMFSVLHYFGDPSTMNVDKIWAGQYVGIKSDYRRKTKIAGETFVAIDFTFAGIRKNTVNGQAFLGKGELVSKVVEIEKMKK